MPLCREHNSRVRQREGNLPPADKQRRPGGGRPNAYPPSVTPRVIETLVTEQALIGSNIGPAQVKAVFATHSRSPAWEG